MQNTLLLLKHSIFFYVYAESWKADNVTNVVNNSTRMTNQWISSIKFNLFGKALFESKMKGNDFFAPLVGKRIGMQGIAFKSPAHLKSFFNGLEYASQSVSKAFVGCHMLSWYVFKICKIEVSVFSSFTTVIGIIVFFFLVEYLLLNHSFETKFKQYY